MMDVVVRFSLIWAMWICAIVLTVLVAAASWPVNAIVGLMLLPPMYLLPISATITEIRDIRDGTY